MRFASLTSLVLLTASCGGAEPPPAVSVAPRAPVTSPSPAAPAAPTVVSRGEWNRAAQELGLPFVWVADANGDQKASLDELAVVWGMPVTASLKRFAPGGTHVTGEARDALEKLVAERSKELETFVLGAVAAQVASAPAAGQPGRVRAELAQSRPTLVATDLTGELAVWRPFVQKMEAVGFVLERLYEKQLGADELSARVPATDPAAQTLFFRNHGPECVAPKTQNDPECTAIPGLAKSKRAGLYPKPMLVEEKFCERLTKSGDKRLMDPFHVVKDDGGKLVAVPYPVAFKAEMDEASRLLEEAAEAVPDAKEQALKTYLLAAAKAFKDNGWFKADEAWAKMGVDNSRWYVRAAPDETYSEPCNAKGMFHLSFGLINQASLEWQRKLAPLKSDMEKSIAALAGAPYKARAVSFKLPDFVNIVLNTGDSRAPSGVTIGQSLPNFGPVANEGRGRTVAMTNFYQDPDSVAALEATSRSLFCADTMAIYSKSPAPLLMSTVLHEAAHNLGPAHQYKVGGKTDREVFGGPLASTLEELKAQTAALFYADWLAASGKIEPRMARESHVRDLAWAFGHVSRGMYNETHQPRPYSQLAAIQLGLLLNDGAIAWRAGEKAANGTDVGCLSANLDKFPEATKKMLTLVAGIKGRGDRPLAEQLVTEHVDCQAGDAARCKAVQAAVTERVLREPKPTFLYALRFH